MRVAYADPPYPGLAEKWYGAEADYDGEVDHADLVAQLVREFPDGWALSTSTTALREVWNLCPPETRVAAWVKPFAAYKRQRVTLAWEPVLYVARVKRDERGAGGTFVRDWVAVAPDVFRGGSASGLRGTKPRAFCYWVFDLLGLGPEDELVDLYPGSGGVGAAWDSWRRQLRAFA